MSDFRFNKRERLKSLKEISKLFQEGQSLYSYPVKLLYSVSKDTNKLSVPVQCGVSVAKKKYKKAVERNLLKRRMREAYRLNKEDIIKSAEKKGLRISLFFLYLSGDREAYPVIEKGVKRCLDMLNLEIEKMSAKK